MRDWVTQYRHVNRVVRHHLVQNGAIVSGVTAKDVWFGRVDPHHVINLKEPRPSQTVVSFLRDHKKQVPLVAVTVEDIRDTAASSFVCFEKNDVCLG